MTLDHFALPYQGDDQFLGAALPFLTEGAERGDTVFVATNPRKRAALRAELDGAVQFLDQGVFYEHPTRIVAKVLRQWQEGKAEGRGLRILGEPHWETWGKWEVLEWQRLESLVNLVFADTDASFMCPYDLGALPLPILDAARRTHPHSAHGRFRRANPGYLEPGLFGAMCDREPLAPAPADSAAMPVFSPDMRDLRALVAGHARDLGVPGGTLHQLLVAVTEVATNALRHGTPPVVLRLWPEDGELVCEVADEGHWQPEDSAGPGHFPPNPELPGEIPRLGLWAVRMLCDIVQVRTGPAGTRIRIRTPLCA
ncbi:sensor histidine kinase [Actinocorallia lasiicapitis]